jgi:hypothetical protein
MLKKILYWSPRIIGILAILFMGMFSLDCFDKYETFGKQLTCFSMHNIPTLVFVAAVIIAWKWEMIGGIIFILFFIAAGIFFNSFTNNPASLLVIGPFLLAGILFILCWKIKEEKIARG